MLIDHVTYFLKKKFKALRRLYKTIAILGQTYKLESLSNPSSQKLPSHSLWSRQTNTHCVLHTTLLYGFHMFLIPFTLLGMVSASSCLFPNHHSRLNPDEVWPIWYISWFFLLSMHLYRFFQVQPLPWASIALHLHFHMASVTFNIVLLWFKVAVSYQNVSCLSPNWRLKQGFECK